VVRGKPEQPQQWCIDVLDYATIAKSQGNAFGAVIEESLESVRELITARPRSPRRNCHDQASDRRQERQQRM
jgi:hypothetical protein